MKYRVFWPDRANFPLLRNARGDDRESLSRLSGVSKSRAPVLDVEGNTRGLGAEETDTRGLSLIAREFLVTGLLRSRTSMLREISRERECNGWLGLGNRQG